jgi:hypothetical protein
MPRDQYGYMEKLKGTVPRSKIYDNIKDAKTQKKAISKSITPSAKKEGFRYVIAEVKDGKYI